MADKKISALTGATTPLDGTEVLPIVQSGATVKVANNDLRPKQIQSNATSGVLQVVGPAAAATRVMTTPDANFTAARTDAAQTFTGDQTFAGINISSIVNGIGKTGTFNRTSGAPSGNVSYTGVGFKPSALILIGGIDTVNEKCWGFGTAAAGRNLYSDAANANTSSANTFHFVRLTDTQDATIASMDSDGFTLAWTRTGGGATGNAIVVNYIALK